MSAFMCNLRQAADMMQGIAQGEARIHRVTTDSRDIQAGDLFVALVGERFDAHDFVLQALEAGAAAAVVAADRSFPVDVPLIRVDNTLDALGRMAAAWRRLHRLPVAAITGSSGKTSVKDMTKAILEAEAGTAAVLATSGNLNNHIGVPLTLLRMSDLHRFAVIEMGMNHFGEIRYLTGLAAPDVALVNNALAAHLEGVGSLEGVAQAKGEIFEGLGESGVALVNADDAFGGFWDALNQDRTCQHFGLHQGDFHTTCLELEALGSRYRLVAPQGQIDITLKVPGVHNVRNSLAAAACALTLGAGLEAVQRGLASYAGTPGRLQQKIAANGARLIDDTYNANADSMKAAIDVLAQLPAPRILVLGDIGEAGNDAVRYHAEVGAYARDKGIDCFLATGQNMVHAIAAHGGTGARHFDNIEQLIAVLQPMVTSEHSVLVKGSRFMKMERVIQALQTVAEKEEG